ncbi:50S ribosomal protein L18 [Patescibacteria group bacterium]|nr:50S ribosomal protein L18 [Patescibacteria group bacterium]
MLELNKIKNELKSRRKKRVRARVSGTAKRPRLSVFRSQKHLFVQAIDDKEGKTIVSVHDSEVKMKKREEQAMAMGKLLAQKLAEKKITTAVFDKGYYKYHGLIKAMADGARKEGLNF